MSDVLKYLSDAKIHQLRESVGDNLSTYSDVTKTFEDSITDDDIKSYKNARIEPDLAQKIQMPKNRNETGDAYNSVLVYESIPIPPMYACDERIWTYLSHCELKSYIDRRWPKPAKGKERASYIRSHYFVTGPRGLTRNNAISRLWWMGFIASRCTKLGSPSEALETLLLLSDVRGSFFERNLSMNPDIFDAVASLIKQEYESFKDCFGRGASREQKNKLKNSLFSRDRFRNLMKSLNRVGGYRMLDALEYQNLYDEISVLAEKS